MVTNACYVMRVRLESGDEPGYEPRLLVSSHLRGQEVAVVVSDNGTGIAEDILTSIFNPFFTTRSRAHLVPAWACRWLLTLYVVAVVP